MKITELENILLDYQEEPIMETLYQEISNWCTSHGYHDGLTIAELEESGILTSAEIAEVEEYKKRLEKLGCIAH